MISPFFLWYHTQYHKNALFPPFFHYHRINLPMITGRNHEKRLWYQDYLISMVHIIRFCLWYGVISASDIKIIWYHSPMISPISQISRHLRGELVRARSSASSSLAAAKQPGDECPGEWQRTWSHAWTCCSGCCASSFSELASRCSISLPLPLNLNFKFKLKHRIGSGQTPF